MKAKRQFIFLKLNFETVVSLRKGVICGTIHSHKFLAFVNRAPNIQNKICSGL